MSFQTFTDTAGGKIIPKYLPNNNPATSVLKITQGGNTPIPAPTVNNEQLTIIEQTQGGGQFQIVAFPSPPSPDGEDFVYMGAVPFREANAEGYFVFGHYQSILGGGIVNGVIFILLPNAQNAANSTWEILATTDAGTTIYCGCDAIAEWTNGGRPEVNSTYFFHGSFTQITDVQTQQQQAVPHQLVSFNAVNRFQILPLTGGNFDNAQAWEGGLVLVGLPSTLPFVGEFLIINEAGLSQQGVNLGSIIIYDGGNLKRIGGGGGDYIPNVVSATFDITYRLWLGGEFGPNFPPVINGATITDKKGLICLSAQNGAFPNVVAFPFTIDDLPNQQAEIVSLSSSWDGQSIVINGTGFQVQANGGLATGMAYIDVDTLTIAKFGGIDAIPTNQMSNSIMYDADTYITSYFDDNQFFLFGTEGGVSATFGKDTYALPQYNFQSRVLFWNWVAWAAGGGDLCYSTFAYSSIDGVDGGLYTGNAGSFNAAGGATGVFQNGSKARYIRPDGSAGDAASATFQNSFSTLQLIADLANNKWDVVGTTGNIVFND